MQCEGGASCAVTCIQALLRKEERRRVIRSDERCQIHLVSSSPARNRLRLSLTPSGRCTVQIESPPLAVAAEDEGTCLKVTPVSSISWKRLRMKRGVIWLGRLPAAPPGPDLWVFHARAAACLLSLSGRVRRELAGTCAVLTNVSKVLTSLSVKGA